jgi:hypothetical protein
VVLGGALALGMAAAPAGASGDVDVTVTAVAGTDVKELRATGTVAAPPRVVRAVIADVDRSRRSCPTSERAGSSDAPRAVTC